MSQSAAREEAVSAAQSASVSPRQEIPVATVPWGYRPGIITAITVFIGFSLAFLRYWGFEATGSWRWYSIFSMSLMAVSLLLQLVALFRSLRLEDVDPATYRITVRWFAFGVLVMVLGVMLAAFESTLA
ncbi:MAG: hypothetical protein ACREPS_03375 [Rhodanobacteraceae bacterium]